jgi:ligand-binding sensor domain-containing protein
MKQDFFTLLMLCFLPFAASAQVKFTNYNSKNSPLFNSLYPSVAIDKDGKVWAGNNLSGLYSFDGTSWEEYHAYNSGLLDDDINDLAIDANNVLWIATDKGISKYNGSNFIRSFDTSNTTMKGESVYTLGIDRNNHVWAASSSINGTYYGITVYDGTNWKNLTGYPSQIAHSRFSEFVFTANNDAWIASDPGITKYADSVFSFYPRAYTGLWSSYTINIDYKGNIWAAGYDGILKYDGKNWNTIENEELGFESASYYRIFPEGDYLWLATSWGLMKYNTITQKIIETYNTTNSQLQNNLIMDIERDPKGNLWLATGSGITKMSFGETGVKEASDLINKISVYPTPSKGVVNLEIPGWKGDSRVELTDLAGRKFYSENLQAESQVHSFDFSALVRGMYLLNIYNNASLIYTKKISLN